MEKINKNANVLDSSPAYLGRQSCSVDRKKQLSYLDKQLKQYKTI